MHIIPEGIPPQTARINCRKLAIKSVVLGAKGEGHWESKDISASGIFHVMMVAVIFTGCCGK